MENKNNLNPIESSLTEKDFVYVQNDASLHDQKFETKPTTFMKDALKRFCKSRSSVVAASILLVLIAMSIIVPFADQNSIESPLGQSSYLPPKWFDADLGGFLDGTGRIDNAVLDPETHSLPTDGSSDYESFAIIGEIAETSSYSDMLSPSVLNYGKGGSVSIQNQSSNNGEGIFDPEDQGILSSKVTLDLSSAYSYSVTFDKENSVVYNDTTLAYYLGFYTEIEKEEEGGTKTSQVMIPLTETKKANSSGELDPLAAEDVSSAINAYLTRESIEGISSLSGQFAILVAEPEDEACVADILAVKKVESSIASVSFADGLTMLKAQNSKADNAYSSFGSPSVGLLHAEVLYGSFRYDYYKAAFGEVDYDFTPSDIQNYIDRGWLIYEWGTGDQPARFELTAEGETYCPLRSVSYQEIIENPLDPTLSSRKVHGKRSLYRQLYFEGKIGSCSMPKYLFGTDRNGKDFFKVVFSGLLTSLGLGLLASAINIVIGLIWGAVSGYFGGWVDMIMERLTEILGGVPFIIVMTLVALLANKNGGGTTFWTFLFALCLTGWIGISSTTRSQFYRYKGREYVLASRTLGASDARLIFKHILPNAVGTIVTSAVLMIPSVIFTEANISYLLPGALALNNTFGVALEGVQSDITKAPYLIVSASIVMALLMISFNLFGNGLRDAFNPSLKGSDQ